MNLIKPHIIYLLLLLLFLSLLVVGFKKFFPWIKVFWIWFFFLKKKTTGKSAVLSSLYVAYHVATCIIESIISEPFFFYPKKE